MKNNEKKLARKKPLEEEIKKNLIRRNIQKQKKEKVKIVINEKERKDS